VPQLINYQGRLTDQTGAAMVPGAYILQFRIWDSPTGGNLIWGQQQQLTVQSNGIFNVILGAPGGSSISGESPAVNSLAYAFPSSNTFLGVAVVAAASGVIANPTEISPRQQLLTVPYAVNANIAASVVPGSITTASLATGAVTLTQLAPRQTLTNVVGVGGVAVSLGCDSQYCPPNDARTDVTNLTITITTTGRPVFLSLVGYANPDTGPSYLFAQGSWSGVDTRAFPNVLFLRGSSVVDYAQFGLTVVINSFVGMYEPPSAFHTVDMPPAGVWTYTVQGEGLSTGAATLTFHNVRLVAYEL